MWQSLKKVDLIEQNQCHFLESSHQTGPKSAIKPYTFFGCCPVF